MNIMFYTPEYGVAENVFGAATFGFVGAEDETCRKAIAFPEDVQGVLIHGSYEECLQRIPEGRSWQAGIVLLGNSGGENDFVHALAEKVKAPLTGGGAAIHPGNGESGLITGQNQAAVLLLSDERYEIEVCCENIHYDILSEHEISYTDTRIIDKIDGQEPAGWLRSQKEKLGLAAEEFEHLTLADAYGVNAHLSQKEGKICSGRDLQPQMYLRYVSKEQVLSRMQEFYDDKDAIVFGCAGLKGILPEKLKAEGLGLFMFGEVCTIDGHSEFGNLMLSKIRICRK